MARLFVPPEQLSGQTLELQGEPHRYLTRVLRLRAGDPVTLFDGVQTEIDARITEAGTRSTRLTLGQRHQRAPRRGRVTLIQALPRGEKMDLVVGKTTELGVLRIVPVHSARVVAQPGGEARLRRWRTIAQEAARQCGRADLPVIDPPRPLAEALAWAAGAEATRLIVWERTPGAPLLRALAGTAAPVVLLVGPEGGFTDDEATAAQNAGFVPVGLGPLILRSETAALVAVALAQAAMGGLE